MYYIIILNIFININYKIQSNCYNMTFTQLQHGNQTLYLLLIYRHQIQNITCSWKSLPRILIVDIYNDNLIILGDFNFHYETNSLQHNIFKSLCNEVNLKQHINLPTHIHNHTLDLTINATDRPLCYKL